MDSYKLKINTAPAVEPVTLSDAKLHLKIDHAADDNVIERLIRTARAQVENYTGLSLITRNASLFLDQWPVIRNHRGWWDGTCEGATSTTSRHPMKLPAAPLKSVDQVIIYDANGNGEALSPDAYFADCMGIPGRLVFKEGTALPEPSQPLNGIEILFTAGYGDNPEDIPADIRQGILQLVAYLYENRGDDIQTAFLNSGAEGLFHSYRRMKV